MSIKLEATLEDLRSIPNNQKVDELFGDQPVP